MRSGQLVLLIGTDGYTPPLGSIGEVVAMCPSGDGDIDVHFPGYPCPVPPDESWCCAPSWLVPLDPKQMEQREECAHAG
jgi:hypothetical protein